MNILAQLKLGLLKPATNTISVLRYHFKFRIEFFKIKAKNAAIALSLASTFNPEFDDFCLNISDILNQKWYDHCIALRKHRMQ